MPQCVYNHIENPKTKPKHEFNVLTLSKFNGTSELYDHKQNSNQTKFVAEYNYFCNCIEFAYHIVLGRFS